MPVGVPILFIVLWIVPHRAVDVKLLNLVSDVSDGLGDNLVVEELMSNRIQQ